MMRSAALALAVAATTARPQRHEQRDTVLVRARDRVTRKDLILTVSRDAGMEELVDSYKQKIVEIADRTQQWLAKADAAYERDARAHDDERARAAGSSHAAMISVMDHGAKGDGVADDKPRSKLLSPRRGARRMSCICPRGIPFCCRQ